MIARFGIVIRCFAIKAVLVARGVRYRREHDLVELLDRMRDNGIGLADDLEEVRRLSPFAAEYRYDDLPPDAEEPLDRHWARDCVRRTRAWAEGVLRRATDAD